MFRISMKMNPQTIALKIAIGELPPGANVRLTLECATVGELLRILHSRYDAWGCLGVDAMGKAHRKEIDAVEEEVGRFLENHPLQ